MNVADADAAFSSFWNSAGTTLVFPTPTADPTTATTSIANPIVSFCYYHISDFDPRLIIVIACRVLVVAPELAVAAPAIQVLNDWVVSLGVGWRLPVFFSVLARPFFEADAPGIT